MRLAKMVEVDDARVEALSPESFRLVLEARGWVVEGDHATLVNADDTVSDSAQLSKATVQDHSDSPLRSLAHHHNGSTYDAFVEVERVQGVLDEVGRRPGRWGPEDVAAAVRAICGLGASDA